MREPFRKAQTYMTTLLALEVCLGIAIILVTAFYHRQLASFLAGMERKVLSGQFFNTYLLGFQLIVTYLCSLAMWRRIWQAPYTPYVALLLKVWMFFCFLIVFCGFGSVWSLFTCADALEKSAELSLVKGIDMYYTCPEWKLMWDGLQYHKECCGVHGYRDWMNAKWMPEAQSNSNDGGNKPNGETILAPYACCKHSCRACYEHYIPRNGENTIPSLNLSEINTEGCLPYFAENMWTIMYVLLGLVLAAFKLDLIICCLAKYIVHKQDSGTDTSEFINMGSAFDDCPPPRPMKNPFMPNGAPKENGHQQRGRRQSRSRQKDKRQSREVDFEIRSYDVTQEVLDSLPVPPTKQSKRRCNCNCNHDNYESRFVH